MGIYVYPIILLQAKSCSGCLFYWTGFSFIPTLSILVPWILKGAPMTKAKTLQ